MDRMARALCNVLHDGPRSGPLTARTDLERFAVRERRSEPTELLSQYTWAQLLILEIVR